MSVNLDKSRRDNILAQIKNFFDLRSGMPAKWQKEIDSLSPEDLFDELDIIIANMCAPEWGGVQAVRDILTSLGIREDEAETLISDSCDFVF